MLENAVRGMHIHIYEAFFMMWKFQAYHSAALTLPVFGVPQIFHSSDHVCKNKVEEK